MKFFFVSVVCFYAQLAFSQWQILGETSSKVADTTLIVDSAEQASDAVTDGSDMTVQLAQSAKAINDVRLTMLDAGYTAEDAAAILQGDTISVASIASMLSTFASTYKRGKQIVARIAAATSASPAGVTASQTIEMNATLTNIQLELEKANIDRQLQRNTERIKTLQTQVAAKQEEMFFKKEFALMQQTSNVAGNSYQPFQVDVEDRTEADNSRFLAMVN